MSLLRCPFSGHPLAPPRLAESLELELDKYLVRRPHLGLDRHFRRYWWGLGGLKVRGPKWGGDDWGKAVPWLEAQPSVQGYGGKGLSRLTLSLGPAPCATSPSS